MTAVWAAGACGFFLAGFFWYLYFYRKEKKLLRRLEEMISQAERGALQRGEITEGEVSALEDRLKKFLEGSLLENRDNRSQKKLIQELISDISHQTLTPVSNLKLYGELLEEGTGDPREIVGTIREQTEKLDFLIRSLVKLSRLETGIIEVCPKREGLQVLFEQLMREYAVKAAGKGVTLVVRPTELEAVYDRKWTLEAVGNLVDNAIKYTRPGGKVSISAHAYTFFVSIEIADNGIGIPEEELPRIFARFYRSPAVADQPGVGIGLYLSREILRAEKGYVKAASGVGQGSVFSVFLPAEQTAVNI